mmetsp:Transcript_30385/g.36103  ORF Transcript_30385/g.36103 Transcript_30385/m.36103 type:complete len:96 (-) Transcript_30385:146-433(-)
MLLTPLPDATIARAAATASPSPFVNDRVCSLFVSSLIEDNGKVVFRKGGASPSATAALRAASINKDGSLGFAASDVVIVESKMRVIAAYLRSGVR